MWQPALAGPQMQGQAPIEAALFVTHGLLRAGGMPQVPVLPPFYVPVAKPAGAQKLRPDKDLPAKRLAVLSVGVGVIRHWLLSITR